MMNNGYMFDAVRGGYVVTPGYCRCGNRHDMWTPCTNFDLVPSDDEILCDCGEIHDRDDDLCPFVPAADAGTASHLEVLARPVSEQPPRMDLPPPLVLPEEACRRMDLPPPLTLPSAVSPPPVAEPEPAAVSRVAGGRWKLRFGRR